jgi:hypothetical protein
VLTQAATRPVRIGRTSSRPNRHHVPNGAPFDIREVLPSGSALGGERLPSVRDALKFVLAAVAKRNIRAKARPLTVLDTRTSPARARAPMWTASPPRCSPRTSYSPVCRPTRSCIPEPRCGLRDGLRAADGSRWTVEGSHESVPGGVDLAAAKPAELVTHRLVVAIEEQVPPLVAQGRG